MASSTTNGKSNQSSENIFLPKSISSDSNANPSNDSSNMRSTGTIPKQRNIPNGINSEVRTKLNNNLQEVSLKSEINGSCAQCDSHVQNNVDLLQTQEKKCAKITLNNFKEAIPNGVHNGSSSQSNQSNYQIKDVNKRYVNILNRNGDHNETFVNVESGPSTSRSRSNVDQPKNSEKAKDSDREYQMNDVSRRYVNILNRNGDNNETFTNVEPGPSTSRFRTNIDQPKNSEKAKYSDREYQINDVSKRYVNILNRNGDHNETFTNVEPGPSTSRSRSNIDQPRNSEKVKDSDREYQNNDVSRRYVNILNRNGDHKETFTNVEPGPSTSRTRSNFEQPKNSENKTKDSDSEYSSDTGNDDLSCSDECCIYTYKGDVADLPSSFMNLDIQENNETQDQSRAGSRGSSPEMDFLEMDFDPGPSCDADSDESSVNSEVNSEANSEANSDIKCDDLPQNEDLESNERESFTLESERNERIKSTSENETNNLSQENSSVTKKFPESQNVLSLETKTSERFVNMVDEPWIPKTASLRTFVSNVLRDSKGHHSSSGDLISPNENILPSTSASTSALDNRVNTSSSLYHSTMEKQLVLDKPPTTSVAHVLAVEKTMIWSEQEAALRQITQIGTSACGATAVINVLLALGYEMPTSEKISECVNTRLRANSSPLVQYLRSRSVAGSTHKDLINGLHKLSNGQVYARFFHLYPERYINLSQWLSYWIKKGAVPIATLNLQKGIKHGNSVPDAWHHQMLFGVGPHGIYLTNPLERVEEGSLWPQLCSESVLLVRREDIISRWSKNDLRNLMDIRDSKWRQLNVVGQIANVIREHHRLVSPHAVSRTHVSIPASYSAGITLAMSVSNPAYELLKYCPELPILNSLP